MNDIPEGEFAHVDVSDVERRLRAVHEVMHEAIAGIAGGDDLGAIFADVERASRPSRPVERMNWSTRLQPRQRVIIACDVEGGYGRTNPAKAALRVDMYDLLEAALNECDISEEQRGPFHDRGDGAMLLMRPSDEVSTVMLMQSFIPLLSKGLAVHATDFPGRAFRLRLAIHFGEVHFDARGVFGADIDLTFRLLNARELKRRLRSSDEPIVVGVSDTFFQSVIGHHHEGVDVRDFEPGIPLQGAQRRQMGWIHVPGHEQPIQHAR